MLKLLVRGELFAALAKRTKVFLECPRETFGFPNLFLQKKVSSRRRHSARSAATRGEAAHSARSAGLEHGARLLAERSDAKYAKKAQRGLGETSVSPRGKGLGENPEGFSPINFFGSKPKKLKKLASAVVRVVKNTQKPTFINRKTDKLQQNL